MEIFPDKDLPRWLNYPPEYLRLVEYGLFKFSPWYLLNEKLARLRYEGLRKRYPKQELFPFAARLDNDDIVCWENDVSNVIIMHDFASEGYTNRRAFPGFWDWFRAAIEDMIEYEG